MSKDFPGQNRGFAFVEFYNHACAQAAKNALSAPTYTCAQLPEVIEPAMPPGRSRLDLSIHTASVYER